MAKDPYNIEFLGLSGGDGIGAGLHRGDGVVIIGEAGRDDPVGHGLSQEECRAISRP